MNCKLCGRGVLDDKGHIADSAWRVTLLTLAGKQMPITLCSRCCDPTPAQVVKIWDGIRDRYTKVSMHLGNDIRLQFVHDPPIGVLARQLWSSLVNDGVVVGLLMPDGGLG